MGRFFLVAFGGSEDLFEILLLLEFKEPFQRCVAARGELKGLLGFSLCCAGDDARARLERAVGGEGQPPGAEVVRGGEIVGGIDSAALFVYIINSV